MVRKLGAYVALRPSRPAHLVIKLQQISSILGDLRANVLQT